MTPEHIYLSFFRLRASLLLNEIFGANEADILQSLLYWLCVQDRAEPV